MSNRIKNKGKLYIILKEIYQRFRISSNNPEITIFSDFASDFVNWSDKLRSGEIGQNFYFDTMLLNLDQSDNKLSKTSKIDKIYFHFHQTSSLIIKLKAHLPDI